MVSDLLFYQYKCFLILVYANWQQITRNNNLRIMYEGRTPVESTGDSYLFDYTKRKVLHIYLFMNLP